MTCNQNGWVRPTVYQAVYNILARRIEDELIPACRRYGLDIVVYNPIVGGLLSGNVVASHLVVPPEEGRFSGGDGSFGAMYRGRYLKESSFEAMRVVEAAIEREKKKLLAGLGEQVEGLGMIEVAFRWLVHHSSLRMAADRGGHDGIIVGVSRPEHLGANLDYIERGPLPDGIVKALDEAWLVAKKDAIDYWHFDLKYGYDTQQELFGPDNEEAA